MLGLGKDLEARGENKEARALLERAQEMAVDEGKLRSIEALQGWASYLENRGWSAQAEDAYERALALAPSHCDVAESLQALYYERNHYLAPKELTPEHAACPELAASWRRARPQTFDEDLEAARLQVLRYPDSISSHIAYARELTSASKIEQAKEVLTEALERHPDALSLVAELADIALVQGGEREAREVLRRAGTEGNESSWLTWSESLLRDEVPLVDLMMDGKEVAKEVAVKAPLTQRSDSDGTRDEAYYAIDFAATRYLPRGTSISLTHTMVRVMTKGAIDRMAEVSVPSGAKVVLVRTVKPDGTTVEPETTAGKDTLSMPNLAPGDFVELAYLTFDTPSTTSKSRRLGSRFFFQMQDISSLHSEFVVINPSGLFLNRNGAPKGEAFTYNGEPAVRFVQKESPRPRPEPSAVSAEEFLPWVQLVAPGVKGSPDEVIRLVLRERLIDALKISPQTSEQLRAWIAASAEAVPKGREKRRDEMVEDLFYRVTSFYTSTHEGFGGELAHEIMMREGNPMLALYALFSRLGVEADIFFAKPLPASPEPHPVSELAHYTAPLMRIVMPDSGQVRWVTPSSQDMMFGALSDLVRGAPAVCVSCDESEQVVLDETLEGGRFDARDQVIEASLDTKGTLEGVARQTYDGPSAVYARAVLRQRTEPTQRAKFISALINQHIPGAAVMGYTIEDQDDRGAPITFMIDFERPQFARPTPSGLEVQAALFPQPLASNLRHLLRAPDSDADRAGAKLSRPARPDPAQRDGCGVALASGGVERGERVRDVRATRRARG